MSPVSRIVIAVGSLLLIATFFLPFWSIYLIAPQYPEGLSMQIWLYKVTGQVDIINGLNHYIGMKHIKAEMFPEFSFLVYVVGLYILLGLIVALSGNRRLLLGYLLLFLLGGIAALVDFYLWGYDYGHNLDPKAAIQVPGFSYQPPLLGHKKLLNFDAFSYPDAGGWIVVAVFAVLILIYFLEWRRNRTQQAPALRSGKAVVALAMGLFLLGSCTPTPQPIVPGKDACAECKMTIADPKFGGEILTKKGRVYKFDDAHCLAGFLKQRKVELPDIHRTLVVQFDHPATFLNIQSAEFVISSQFKSPMGGNAAAFPGKAAAEAASAAIPGSRITNWSTLYNILIK